MNPKVGYFKRMKSYHINHHYKNVELGTLSLLTACCVDFKRMNAVNDVCDQDSASPPRFGTTSSTRCCQWHLMIRK
jgi:hypothetical protein